MPKPDYYARIAITLPPEDLATADRLAAEQDRSRSWIVAEAIRQYAVNSSAKGVAGSEPGRRRERSTTKRAENSDKPTPQPDNALTEPPADSSGLGASRFAQLIRDMALTPEARVRVAEETLRLTQALGKAEITPLLTFERYDDFLDWKQTRGGGA